ncbi:unnamed protein product [Durusdinium trenchii]|uniref:Uncharacterized protein n=1 Tax=Durusdinium trenchii TaxID=1381693 RepID=A0ABP0PPD5_9DINO
MWHSTTSSGSTGSAPAEPKKATAKLGKLTAKAVVQLELQEVLRYQKGRYGLTVRGTCYTFALIAVKGDQKWHIAIANLVRHYGTRGRKRSLEMCYECGAGAPNVPYEDVRSSAKWRRTCYRTRPWMEQPPLAVVPFEGDRAEYLYKRDVFHIMRLGLLRHWVGSALVSLIQWGQTFSIEGEPNNADIQLTRAHSSFKLYCLAVRKTPALRSFSRNLFNWPNTSTAPWANVKASDCVLLANWLVSLLPIFAEEHDERERLLLLQMRDCGQHALDFYQHLLGHGLLLCRSCVAESLRLLFVLPTVQFLPGSDHGHAEDELDIIPLLRSNSKLFALICLYTFSCATYNISGIAVTGALSAVHRVMLEALRTLIVWAFGLWVHYCVDSTSLMGEVWTKWSWLEVMGFVLLVVGQMIYGEMLKIPGLYYPPHEEVEEVMASPGSLKNLSSPVPRTFSPRGAEQ